MKTRTINIVLFVALIVGGMGCDSNVCPSSAIQSEQPVSSNDVKAQAEYSFCAPSIQQDAQRAAIEEICRWADTNDTSVGCAVIVEVKTGNVIAIADCGGTNDEPRPFAVHRQIEPGLLLSPFTMAFAIDSRAISSMESQFTSDRAEPSFNEYRLPSDGSDKSSVMSVSNALVRSSVVVISKIGILCGPRELYDGLSRLGLASSLKTPDRWNIQERTRIPIGQGVRMTALDLARAYAILANHGRSTDGRVVISETTATSVKAALEGAVQDGTGHRVAITGIHIAGKTSTSVRHLTAFRYDYGKYLSAFASIFPAGKPKYAMIVWFETTRNENEPGMHHGGGRAAIASRGIIKRLMAATIQ